MKPSISSLSSLIAGAVTALAVGCGGGSGSGDPNVVVSSHDPAEFTVSYRNRVKLPNESQQVSSDDFAKQLKVRDPVAPIRCLAEESDAYRKAAQFLGGVQWSHPVVRIKDSSLPPLYEGKPVITQSAGSDRAEASNAGAAAPGAPPVIERPDLVGIQNGIAIFLSKQHGLLAVDARNPAAAALSCSMKLPGDPKYFLFKGTEIVIVVNALNGMNRSALLRYSFDGAKFRFMDSVNLEGQTIQDARLFDQTIVMYTSWSKTREMKDPPKYEPEPAPGPEYGGAFTGGGGGGGRAGAADESFGGAPASSSAYPGGGQQADHLGTKVIVVQWDDALAVDWEDALLDDSEKIQTGEPPKDYQLDQLISERKTYKTFVAASDRYIAVPRDVQSTRFAGYQTMSWQECTNYNPRAYQVEQCSVAYERRANPDYRPPNPTTGDYSCNGKSLADCVKEAAPSVSQYVYVPVGRKCEQVWQGRCEKYEMRSSTYPTFKTTQETEMTIYRFEAGSFTKLDGTLGKLVEKGANIAFEQNPLKVTGAIANRNQIQFQNGHLYVFGDQALQTMAVAGNSISYLNRLAVPSDTNRNPSIVFSTDRAMISSNEGGYMGSEVTMLDLATPAFPKMLRAFSMPGQSTQLLLAAGGILGPGQVSFANQGVGRTLQKLTLFSREGGQELDNLLLGTEYDAFESSWFNTQDDDQRIRLSPTGERLFLPYSGRHHAEATEPTAHRLNVSRVDNGKLVSERSFQVSDDIIRTTSIDDNRSLAFANSAAYLIDRTSGDWNLSTLRELFVPFATYRVSDVNDLHARLDRVGSKCKITTLKGKGNIFTVNGPEKVAEKTISCDEGGIPTGWGANLIFNQTRTGVVIDKATGQITELTRADVDKIIGAERPRGYCWLPAGADITKVVLIDYLDTVPTSAITCETPKSK